MQEPRKEWENALFCAVPQVISQIIEHLGYYSVKIITKIHPLTFIERKIRIDLLSTQLKVQTEEQMLFLMWNFMGWKIDIRKEVYKWLIRKKEQIKVKYNKIVKMQ